MIQSANAAIPVNKRNPTPHRITGVLFTPPHFMQDELSPCTSCPVIIPHSLQYAAYCIYIPRCFE